MNKIIKKNNEAFLLTHLGLGDNILCIGMANFLANIYDKVRVVCKEHNQANLNMLLSNPKIEFVGVKDDYEISPNYGFNINFFHMITRNWDVYLCGSHILNGVRHGPFPLGFYDDINIDRIVLWTHFSCNKPQESLDLYEKVKNQKYIIVHNLSSTGKVFDSTRVIRDYVKDYNRDEMLVINFNINEYDKTHKFYQIAEEFINKPLAHYQDLIINAEYLFMTDSSIWCMAIQLPIKTENCYVLSRGNVSYEHLYDETIFTKELNKRKFKQILLC